MNYDPVRFKSGIAAALCSKARAFQKKQMYLYGHVAKDGETPTHPNINGEDYVGVVAPSIYSFYTPEVQKQYPYIWVSHNFANIIATLSTSAVYWTDDTEQHKPAKEVLLAVESGSRISYILTKETDTEWRYNEGAEWTFERDGMVDYAYFRNGFDWTNHPIPKADGSPYLAAYDPIPVYE